MRTTRFPKRIPPSAIRHGNVGFPIGPFLHEINHCAFETAAAFAATNAQSISGTTTVLAHSLGNMVVSSAIQDHGFRPARYFMLNAAVPEEAYNASAWDDTPLYNPMVHEEWIYYPSRTWASHWYNLFPTNDSRRGLSWKNRFADVPDRTDLYNHYSTGEEVLSLFATPDSNGNETITIESETGGDMTYHSWQKQERFKGRFGVDFWGGNAGTSEMGWGFSTQGYYGNGTPPLYQTVYDPTNPTNFVVVRIPPYGTNDAHAASSEQLRIDPVFNHDPAGLLSSNLQLDDIDEILARGVPALSGPVGAKPVGVNFNGTENDLNSLANAGNWPRNGESSRNGWHHSDIKDVALPFVFQRFFTIPASASNEFAALVSSVSNCTSKVISYAEITNRSTVKATITLHRQGDCYNRNEVVHLDILQTNHVWHIVNWDVDEKVRVDMNCVTKTISCHFIQTRFDDDWDN